LSIMKGLWPGVAYHDWKKMNPCREVVYSRVDGKRENFPAMRALDEFKSPTAMGIFFGGDWWLTEKIYLKGDARLFGEHSGTFSAQHHFEWYN